MSTITELNAEEREINDILFFMDEESDDQEDLDITEMLNQKLSEIRGTVEQKLKYLSNVIAENRADVHAKKEILDRTEKRHQQAINRSKSIEWLMREMMLDAGINKIDGDYCTPRIQKGREVVFYPEDFDVDQLPDEFKRRIPEVIEPMKTEIKKAVKNGEDVCGLSLVRGESILVVA